MNFPAEMWVAANTLFLFGIAVMGYLTNRRINKVKKIVDGPLTLALRSNKELAELVVQLRGTAEDIAAAEKAAAICANREEGKKS